MYKEAYEHLKFCASVYRWQYSRNKYFLHEHPKSARSWKTPEMSRLMEDDRVKSFESDMGVQFQIVALQAVMAQLLDGDTIHHACGINPFVAKTDPKSSQKASQRQIDVAKRVLQWRWILIDEISMVSAEPLAMDDLVVRLKISKGSVSQGLKFLRTLGAIREVEGPDVRRTYYEGDIELKKLVGGFIREQMRPHMAVSYTHLTLPTKA